MTIVVILPAAVALVGLLMFALCSNGKLVEIGKILMCIGLFFVVWALAGRVVHVP